MRRGRRTRRMLSIMSAGNDIIEIEQKERLSREEVAVRLRHLADMLSRHNDIEFERGGMRFKIKVPDEINLKLELDVESDEREFEIELTW
jgi:amphi-Trp domain-containing protein